MIIDKLKIEDGTITVNYSGLSESFRIATNDEAKASLYLAAADVALLARVVLCLKVEGAGFLAIAFSNGDNSGTRLVLEVPTAGGDSAKISCPKIDRGEYRDGKTQAVVEEHPRTLYERAVCVFEKEIAEFIKGKRLQMALPFDMGPEEREVDRLGRAVVAELNKRGDGLATEGRVFEFAAERAAN